jgi:hypothetical protein
LVGIVYSGVEFADLIVERVLGALKVDLCCLVRVDGAAKRFDEVEVCVFVDKVM